MTEIRDGKTIDAVFADAAETHGARPFLAVPENPERRYLPNGIEISYREAAAQVDTLATLYKAAGYGLGHRVATLLENRPDYVLHKLALNRIGACCVPINPELRPAEMQYLLEHSAPDLALVLSDREEQMAEALALSAHKPPLVLMETVGSVTLPSPGQAAAAGEPTPETPACILYTSGTTGRPKGCVLSHGYEVAAGERYASLGGIATIRPGAERIYNPLPLYHVNAGVLSLMGAIVTGNCQIQPDRFHPQRWWAEVAETRATVVHYLGVIVAMLMKQAPSDCDRAHAVRFGIGAGIEPQLHRAFEERFGFPMVEVWGMTEMVRVPADSVEPRQLGTRAFGRAYPGLDMQVVDEADRPLPNGEPGELVVRHSAATPRRGFFSGYLDDAAATEDAWRGGWFHTGDTVTRDPDGMMHFVDRKKNIIRRSGENIAAAEIEAVLLTHPNVHQVAVMAVQDEVREEEVLACIALKQPRSSPEAAQELFDHCFDRLAYYKAPGWIHILDSIPTTGTQKIQKHSIYPAGTDPRTADGIVDLRDRKRRRA